MSNIVERKFMEWKKQLRLLEKNKQWDFAIDLMQEVVKKNSDNVDVYIYTIYLLMNLLVEEDYDDNQHDYYATLLKQYFNDSYVKFFDNAEYLFCVGTIAAMSEWYLGIDVKDYETMLEKAILLEPDNLVYKSTQYMSLNMNILEERKQIAFYTRLLSNENSALSKDMKSKGAFGEYLFECTQGWFKRKVEKYCKSVKNS